MSSDESCKKCKSCNKGKSTILIFRLEDFKKCDTHHRVPESFTHKRCKGTGYILPKKGETRCANCMHQTHFLKDCNLCECDKSEPFHLTSDAEVKEIESLGYDVFLFRKGIEPISFKCNKEHNLSENSKLVLIEGYYEI